MNKYFFVVPILPIFIGMAITRLMLRHSTRLTGYLHTRLTQVSFQACVDECQNTVGCHSINYERRSTLCEINSKRISDLTNINTAAVGFVYWEKQTVVNSIECGDSTCTKRESCDKDTMSCLNKGCENFYVHPAYGTVTGNMKDVNSTVYLSCFSDNIVSATKWNPVCKETGLWDVPPCEPVCSGGWIRYGQHCYQFNTADLAWLDAKEYCESIGSTLVIVNDSAEHDFLRETAQANGLDRIWIGLRWVKNNKTFLWVDGSPLTISFWSSSNPDYYECVLMSESIGYLWNDARDCTWQRKFIGEKDVDVNH